MDKGQVQAIACTNLNCGGVALIFVFVLLFIFLKLTSNIRSLIFPFEREVFAAAITTWFSAVTVVTFPRI